MSDDLVRQALEELQDLVRCQCHDAYKDRGLHDPTCCCDSAEAVKVVSDRIEELEAENRLLQDAVYIDDLTVTMQANDKTKALAGVGRALGFLDANMPEEAKAALRATLAELTGGKDE